MWETIAPAAIGFLSNAMMATSSANIAREQNEYNAQAVASTNAMNERLTREQWARDDNAVQRRVADVQAAGFSPLAALGSEAGNSQPSSIFMNDKQDRSAEIQAKQQAALNNIAISNALVQNQLTKAQIEHTQAETRKTNVEADLQDHDYNFYKNSVIPSSFTRETFGQVISLLANGKEVSQELLDSATKMLAQILPESAFNFLKSAGNGNPLEGAVDLVGNIQNPDSIVSKIKHKVTMVSESSNVKKGKTLSSLQAKAAQQYSHGSQPTKKKKITYNKH